MSIRNLPLIPRSVNHTKIPKTLHNSETEGSSTMPTNRFSLNFPKLSHRPGIVSMLNNKGVIYMERRQYDKAKKSLSRALQMVAKDGTSESVARAVVANGKPVTPDPLPLLPSSRPKHDDYKAKRCPIQSEMVTTTSLPSSLPAMEADRSKNTFHHRSEYDEGMDYFKTPLRLEDSSRSVNGTILFNLGRVSHNQGNYKDALELYQRSLEALASWPTSDEPLKLAILFGIAQIEYISGSHFESFKTYETSLSLARSAFGEESIEVAACLNCIGVLHYVTPGGEKDSALAALQKSLSLRRSIRGDDHIDVGTTWNNVGRVYFQQMLYDEALEAYGEALRIRQACQGESVDCAAVYFNIGQVHHQLGQQSEALRHYRDFLRLAKTFFGDYHRDICIVITSIGQVFHERKEYKRALKAFYHALRIGRVALGPHHAEIAITLNKLGNLHYEAGDLESALEVYHQGLEVELAVLEPGNPNVFVTNTNIAEIHKHRGEYDKAVEYYKNVVDLQRKHGHDDVDIANTLSSIGTF
jgi:tetratricopeptide (TPR) repeat protein